MRFLLDHRFQDSQRKAAKPVVASSSRVNDKEFSFGFQIDAPTRVVSDSASPFPSRRDKLAIFPASVASLFELFERACVCQDRSPLGSHNVLHATQHGENPWKVLSEIAATNSEQVPESFAA